MPDLYPEVPYEDPYAWQYDDAPYRFAMAPPPTPFQTKPPSEIVYRGNESDDTPSARQSKQVAGVRYGDDPTLHMAPTFNTPHYEGNPYWYERPFDDMSQWTVEPGGLYSQPYQWWEPEDYTITPPSGWDTQPPSSPSGRVVPVPGLPPNFFADPVTGHVWANNSGTPEWQGNVYYTEDPYLTRAYEAERQSKGYKPLTMQGRDANWEFSQRGTWGNEWYSGNTDAYNTPPQRYNPYREYKLERDVYDPRPTIAFASLIAAPIAAPALAGAFGGGVAGAGVAGGVMGGAGALASEALTGNLFHHPLESAKRTAIGGGMGAATAGGARALGSTGMSPWAANALTGAATSTAGQYLTGGEVDPWRVGGSAAAGALSGAGRTSTGQPQPWKPATDILAPVARTAGNVPSLLEDEKERKRREAARRSQR